MSDTLRILIAEDNPLFADAACTLLDMKGHTYRCVDNGDEALSLIKTFKPHVILLDIGIKGTDGLGVCKAIKSDPDTRGTYIVIVSGRDAEKAAAAAGCDRFILKPYSPTSFMQLITSLEKKLV
jgi:CheY-like chemotaxis protein